MASLSLTTSAQGPSLNDFFNRAEREAPTRPLIVDGNEVAVVAEVDSCCCFNLFSSSPSAIERDINRRTWTAFENAIRNTCPDKRVFALRCDRIRQRYQVNFEAAKEQGAPLLVDHIDRVAVGCARVFMEDIRMLLNGESARDLSRDALAGHVDTLQQGISYIGNCAPAHEIRGGPDTCADLFYYDPFKWDRKRVHLSQNIGELVWNGHRIHDLPWVERMVKVFTSLEMEEGEVIPAVDPQGGIDYYEVYRKIGTGDGLVAYALRPITRDSTLTPSLYFRPSQISLVSEDTVETWFNDCEGEIGKTGYDAAHPLFEELMRDPYFRQNQKIRLVGYSLGGSQGQRFFCRFWRDIWQAIFFNDPSIDEATATSNRDEIMNYEREEGEASPFPEVHIYRTRASDNADEGDIVDYAGRMHIGCGIRRDDFKLYLSEFRNAPARRTRMSPGFGPHSHRAGEPVHRELNPELPFAFEGDELHRQLDNFQRGENIAWYERTRLFWGTQVLYRVIYGLYIGIKTILSCFGVRIFRSSRREASNNI